MVNRLGLALILMFFCSPYAQAAEWAARDVGATIGLIGLPACFAAGLAALALSGIHRAHFAERLLQTKGLKAYVDDEIENPLKYWEAFDDLEVTAQTAVTPELAAKDGQLDVVQASTGKKLGRTAQQQALIALDEATSLLSKR